MGERGLRGIVQLFLSICAVSIIILSGYGTAFSQPQLLGCVWADSDLPIAYVIDTSTFSNTEATAIENAFNTWSSVSGSSLRFVRKPFNGQTLKENPYNPPYDPVFVTKLSLDHIPSAYQSLIAESGGAAAYPIPPCPNGRLLSGVIIFRTKPVSCIDPTSSGTSWSTSDTIGNSARDLESVALHEIGHLIGLAHPTPSSLWDALFDSICQGGIPSVNKAQTIMGYIPFGKSFRSLYKNDEDVVRSLYPLTTGSVSAHLHQNSASGPPLPGATVTCGGQSTTTSSNGSFSLPGVPTGNQALSFSMSGYQSYSMPVLITAGQTVDVGDRWLVKNPTPTPTCPSGNGLYCGDPSMGQNANYLYLCSNGNYSLSKQCSNGCLQNPPGVNDTCRTASQTCPSGNGLYCGNSELGQNPGYLYQCTNGSYSIKTKCPYGCKVNPPGTNDVCSSTPQSTSEPDLNVDKVTVKKSGQDSTHTLNLQPGEAFQIDVWIKNVGDATASKEFTINYLLSSDKTFNKYDRIIGVDHVKDDVKEDKTYHDSKVKGINAPSTPGTYYIGAWVDSPQDNNNQNDFSKGDDEIAKIIVAYGYPFLISSDPFDGATNVPVTNRTISFTFSEPMSQSGGFLFTGNPCDSELQTMLNNFQWNTSWNTDKTTAYWTFTNNLPPNCTISWELVRGLSGGFKDLDGNLLPDGTMGRFTTGNTIGTILLPQTGQTKCYDTAGSEITCAGTGQDGEIRAGVPWPYPRFTITYCDANGPCSDQSSDCDANASTDMVQDNLTGLVWARNGNLPGMPNTWQDSLNYANTLTLCGYSDWRLPNVNELESLINADEPNTATWLNIQGFSNVQPFIYWSSTTSTYYTDYAWYVYMLDGSMGTEVTHYVDKGSYTSYVWPVRSGQYTSGVVSLPRTGQTISYATGDDGDLKRGVEWPVPRFYDTGNGTVTDNLTGLIWTKDANVPGPSMCNPGIYKTWQNAVNYVACLNTNSYLGYNDWRMPNRKELLSLIDYSNYGPALPSDHPFTGVQSGYYWSSTTTAVDWTAACNVNMNGDGGVGGFRKVSFRGDFYFPVWPVRGGNVTVPTPSSIPLITGVVRDRNTGIPIQNALSRFG